MLSSGGSFADVKPPDGVEQIALEAINLKLRIDRKKPARKRRKRCPSTGPSSELGNSQEGACFESLEEAASQSSLYEDDMLLLDEPLLCTSRPEDLLWEEERQAMDISNHVVKNTPNLSKRTAAASNPDDEADGEEGESVASHQLTQLVDAALRLTICERPNKLPAGIKFKKTDLAARLSEFAPALWSPEYLPAMSQRAVFLPTIAHALSHSLYKNARSASLQSKIEMLATKCAESAEENQSAKETASQMTAPLSASSAYHAISVKLWQLLQRELFDEKAARRLKPLKILKDAVATARPDGDDLLEDLAVADRQDDMLPFAAEDQLLDWSDDDLGPHFSEDDLLFGSEPGELEEPEELEDPESLWNYTPAWPSDQASDEFVEGLLMPVPRRPARLSFTGSGFELNASPSSGSRSRAHEYLEPCVEMCELDDEQIGEWMQDGTSDGDVIMSF
ncbi:hypothetical protein H2201_006984 [Coniosporium apollinis]|uniref:Uncharacterized protein n=2 Tax=Coniosporium TaxID=2810619 RepID=A0ABQ9NNK9_9PEZI|nr:hypothetical protein H2199_004855 [Cladosporium sp. JES 115]KAJ9660238.1 hypothetical protein H2201_006984 [Coniosporium apollinis]